jgi:hypothetical protein
MTNTTPEKMPIANPDWYYESVKIDMITESTCLMMIVPAADIKIKSVTDQMAEKATTFSSPPSVISGQKWVRKMSST